MVLLKKSSGILAVSSGTYTYVQTFRWLTIHLYSGSSITRGSSWTTWPVTSQHGVASQKAWNLSP